MNSWRATPLEVLPGRGILGNVCFQTQQLLFPLPFAKKNYFHPTVSLVRIRQMFRLSESESLSNYSIRGNVEVLYEVFFYGLSPVIGESHISIEFPDIVGVSFDYEPERIKFR